MYKASPSGLLVDSPAVAGSVASDHSFLADEPWQVYLC